MKTSQKFAIKLNKLPLANVTGTGMVTTEDEGNQSTKNSQHMSMNNTG